MRPIDGQNFVSLQPITNKMKQMKKVRLLLTILLLMTTTLVKAGHFTVGDKSFLLNGEPFVVKAAEIHYPRIPQPYWEHRIKMCKAIALRCARPSG